MGAWKIECFRDFGKEGRGLTGRGVVKNKQEKWGERDKIKYIKKLANKILN